MKIFKRLFITLVAVLMVLTYAPTKAWADEVFWVVKYDNNTGVLYAESTDTQPSGTYYASEEEAVAAYQSGAQATITYGGQTTYYANPYPAFLDVNNYTGSVKADDLVMKLFADCNYETYDASFTISVPMTLDLNGHIMAFGQYGKKGYTYRFQKDFVLKDTSVGETGVLYGINNTAAILLGTSSAGSTFTLESGTIKSETAIFDTYSNCTINVTGGHMVSYSKYGVGDSRGIFAELSSGCALNISSGEFRSDQSAKSWDTMSFDPMGYPTKNVNANSTISVTGGTFSGQAIQKYVPGYTADQSFTNENPTITVGDYNITRTTVSSPYGAAAYDVYLYTVAPVPVNYVAQIGETQYESFDEAVAAAQAGDTIVLLDDITFGTDRSVPVWGNAGEQPFNIDLNGYTFQTDSEVSIDAGNNGYKASAFCFAFDNEANITVSGGDIKTAYGAGVYISGENVSLTLEDVDIAQNYPQNVQTTNEYSSAVRITYEGSVEINGGTYGGKNSIAVSNTGGTVVINDGTFYNDIFFSNYTSKSYYDNSRDAVKSITINGGTFLGNFVNPDKGNLVIKGGSFTSDPTAYVAEGYKVTEASGVYTVSAVNYVAQIGNEKYETLAAAVAAASDGDTIVLIDNLTISSYVMVKKDITLDLNGYTIEVNGGTYGLISSRYNLVITDSSTNGDGKIYSTAKEAVLVQNGGTLTVNGGTIEAAYYATSGIGGYAIYVLSGSANVNAGNIVAGSGDTCIYARNASEVEINGGVVTSASWGIVMIDTSILTVNDGTITGNTYAISTNGTSGQNAQIIITGGTIGNENNGSGIYLPSGSLDVSGGTITGKTGIYFKSTNLNITGGEIVGVGPAVEYNYSGNGSNSTGDALVIDSCGYPNGIDNVNVSGGHFVSANASPVKVYTYQENEPVEKFITGGTYASVSPDAEYIAEGYKAVEENEIYSVVPVTYVAQIGDVQYETLAAAINAANQAENGVKTTIVLINDEAFDYTTGGMTINAGKVVEIDLNGHQVVGTANSGTTSAFINNYGSLTILDSTDVDEDGVDCGRLATGANPSWVWDGSDSYSGSYASNLINNLGTVVVKSGLLQNLSSGSAAYVVDNNSTNYDVSLTVTGGKLLAAKSSVRQFANSKTHANALTVTGGTIQGGRFGVVVHEYGQLAMNLSGGTITTTDTDNYAVNVWTTSATDTQYANINVSGDVVIDGYLYLTDLGRKSSTGTPATVSISGGYIEGLIFYGNTDGLEGSVTGGHYVLNSVTDEEVAYLLSEQCIADGYEVAENKGADAEEYPYIVQEAVTYVAQIGNVKYETLAAAVAAANNSDTIVLINNATESNYFFVQKNITIDLNGYTASFTGSYGIIVHNGQLTIDDSGVDGKLTCSGSRTIQVQGATGELTVNGGTIENTKQEGIAVNISNTGKSVVINDGSIIAGTNGYGVQANGTSTLTINGGAITSGGWGVTPFDTATITVNDGTITATKYAIAANGNSGNNATIIINGGYIGDEINDAGIYVPSGSLTVIDGEIVGKNGIYFKSTNLDIRGGSIRGVGNYQEYNYNGNGSNPTGDALVIDSCGYPNGIDDVYVSGGHFVSANAKAVATYTYENNAPVVGFITGGTFSSEPEAALIAEGYKAVAVENDMYKVGPVEVTSDTEGTIEGDVVPQTITYTVNTIVKESNDQEAQTIEENTNLEVTVSANASETTNGSGAGVAKASLANIKDDATLQEIVTSAIEAAGSSINEATVAAEIEITVVKGAGDTQTEKKVVYEVHPEAIVKVNNEVVGNVELDNSQLKGTFKFKLYAGDIAEDGTYVKVTHIHSNDESEVMGSFLVTDGYIEITGVTSFSEFELEAVELEDVPHAAFGFNISLEESINIVYSVKNLIGDLEDFEIVYTDPTTGQEVSVQPTSRSVNKYTIAKCAARQMADEFSVKVYYQGSQINQTDTLSIKDYCEIIINGNYNNYLKDLCKATLDYGKYAQIEFAYNLENLANGGTDYFVNEEIDVPAYDGEILNRFSDLGVSFSLVTKSQTIFHVYFTSYNEEAYGFIVNGQVPSEKNLRMIAPYKYDVTINNIKARDLGEKVEIVLDLAGEQDQMTVRLSPVDYMGYAVATDSQVEINRAYYNYYLKAYDYFNNK